MNATTFEIKAALRAMRSLADLWQLTPAERAQLMSSDIDLARYEHDPEHVSDDLQRRWGRVLTIYRLRRTLLPAGDQAVWVRSRDAGGEMVIDLMLHDPQRLEVALEAKLAECVVA